MYVWACEIILFGMLHGYLFFKANSSHEAIELKKEGKYNIKSDIEKYLSEGRKKQKNKKFN